MHQTDSAINLVYNLFKELRLSRDLFGDEIYFTSQLSLQNNSKLFEQGKIWGELNERKKDKRNLNINTYIVRMKRDVEFSLCMLRSYIVGREVQLHTVFNSKVFGD